jgi:predicted nucleic-acid-binding protein
MVIFDTNAILRYILQDNEPMALVVTETLDNNVCFIPVEVVTEIVYVLSKVYNIDRNIISQTISQTIQVNNIMVAEKPVVLHALVTYAATNLDFVDCLLIGYGKIKNYSVFSFDKALNKQLKKDSF